jgi:O-antigen ligase
MRRVRRVNDEPTAGSAPPAVRRRGVYQEAVEPARVDGVRPVAVLTAFALLVAVVTTVTVSSFRHTGLWWLPGGAWAAVVIGVYGSWHVRRRRDRLRAREAARAE